MKIIYFLQNHSINLPEIWSDCSIYVCLWLVSIVLLAIWSANNYKRSIKKEYEEKKDSSIHSLNHLVDKLESENSYLKQAFDSYKYDTQREIIRLKQFEQLRDNKGRFLSKITQL